jgi:tRNA A37 methylthiotransferase MiaB
LFGSCDAAGVREVIENGQDVNVWGPDERAPLMSALFALSLKRWRDPRVRFGDMVPERQNIDEGTTSGK